MNCVKFLFHYIEGLEDSWYNRSLEATETSPVRKTMRQFISFLSVRVKCQIGFIAIHTRNRNIMIWLHASLRP